MAHDTAGRQHQSSNREARQWGVVIALVGALVGVPVALLAEFEFGLLASFGLSGNLALVVMLGT